MIDVRDNVRWLHTSAWATLGSQVAVVVLQFVTYSMFIS